MSKSKRIETLKAVAENKKQEALDSTEKAINRLIKEGKRITFSNVAASAGVSVSYLYKYPEIKDRIQQLRRQQEHPNKAIAPQPASDKSKTVIINQFRDKIKKLETERDELRRAVENLTGRLYYYHEIESQIESLKVENIELKKQLENYHNLPANDSKVASLDKKRLQKSDSNDKISSELEALNIRVNSTLSSLIKQAPEEIVLQAIESLKDALKYTSVRNPSGFLVKAIKNAWKPNEDYEQQSQVDAFDEWYSLAIAKKLVLASTNRDGVQYVLTSDSRWIPFEEIVVEYPLERLKALI